MNSPKISCIMPAYNAGRYLKTAIDSILNQTYRDFELIIINDGSTDNTEEIILSYSDSRIVYIRNDHNLKLIKTLNKGIDNARGEFISRMDSDDQALPDMFERELLGFDQHPDVGIINTLTYHMNENGSGIRPNRQYFRISPEVCSVVCFYANHISHPGVMVKGDLMRKYRYNDCSDFLHYEDKELWNRMFADGIKCYTLNERLLNYRESSTSINAVYGNERYARMDAFRRKYVKHRWGYDMEMLPEIIDFKTFIKHYDALLCLWNYLKKKDYITPSVYVEILRWHVHFFLGIGKRLLCKRLEKMKKQLTVLDK